VPAVSSDPRAGLSALRAAVADDRESCRAAAARARAVAGPHLRGKTAVPGRVPPGAVPSPAAPADPDTAASAPGTVVDAPEGQSAVSYDLLVRAQGGDSEAFGQLYDRYVDAVYRYIYYRVASPQLAEDLTSETFLRALRRLSSFTWQGRDVGAWFVTIARNLVADHYKSSRYRLEMPTDDIAGAGAALAEDGPEEAVLDGMTNAVLLAAVKQLNPEQQECVVLRFLQGMSVAETAQIMGKNDGAVKALQYRAVRALGRLLPEGMQP
jgi:RNA polymerase sigma-70 factor, ECF subfamily